MRLQAHSEDQNLESKHGAAGSDVSDGLLLRSVSAYAVIAEAMFVIKSIRDTQM